MKKTKIIVYMVMFLILLISVNARNCSELVTDIEIVIDSEPYILEMNTFFAILPESYRTESFDCVSYIEIDDKIIQVNPEQVTYSERKIPIFPKREENREFFTSYNGVVNSYFTYKELVAYTQFILGVKCGSRDSDTTLVGEKCIIPQYKELKSMGTRGVWATENAEMLFILILVIVIIIIAMGYYYRKAKKLF